MTATEKRHLDRIAAMPCALCGASPVHVHHIRAGQGMGERASHFLTIPLCPECHQGKEGIHGNRALLKVRKVDELGLLAKTIEGLTCHA